MTKITNFKQSNSKPDKALAPVKPAKATVKHEMRVFAVALSAINEWFDTLRYNVIKKGWELEGCEITEDRLNSMYIRIHTAYPDGQNLSNAQWWIFLKSTYVPRFNPLIDYFENLKPTKGQLTKLLSSIELDPSQGMPVKLAHRLITRWLVGIVASVFEGNFNDLMLILLGKKGCGKSEFFKRLLPPELRQYLTVIEELTGDKDQLILFTKNLLVFYDECDGIAYKNAAHSVRALLSKNFFELRVPYAMLAQKLKRYGSMCGATNKKDIVSDPEHNRRLLPVQVRWIDRERYNAVDKHLLFSELYQMYKGGYSWHLTEKEIAALDKYTGGNSVVDEATESVQKYYVQDMEAFTTASEITSTLNTYTGFKLNAARVGKALSALGFTAARVKRNGTVQRGWRAAFVLDAEQVNR